MELIRGDVSSNIGACLANAFLLNLKDMGFLNPSIPLNKSKIDREKARVKVTIHQKHVQDYNNLIYIGVNCKVDKDTLLYKEITEENGDKNFFKMQGTRSPLNIHRGDGHFK